MVLAPRNALFCEFFEKSDKIIWRGREKPLSLHPLNERNTVLTDKFKRLRNVLWKIETIDKTSSTKPDRAIGQTKVEQCENKYLIFVI